MFNKLIGQRCMFVAPRYLYRGPVVAIEGSIFELGPGSTKVIQLGQESITEEIKVGETWFIDAAACEAFGLERNVWMHS